MELIRIKQREFRALSEYRHTWAKEKPAKRSQTVRELLKWDIGYRPSMERLQSEQAGDSNCNRVLPS